MTGAAHAGGMSEHFIVWSHSGGLAKPITAQLIAGGINEHLPPGASPDETPSFLSRGGLYRKRGEAWFDRTVIRPFRIRFTQN